VLERQTCLALPARLSLCGDIAQGGAAQVVLAALAEILRADAGETMVATVPAAHWALSATRTAPPNHRNAARR